MRHALAVDIGGSVLRVARVDAAGRVLDRRLAATAAEAGPDAVLAQIAALAADLAPLDEAPVGIGAAAPGPLDPLAGLALAPPTLGGWHAVPLAARLSAEFGLPARIENDANAAALGEWRFGAGRGCRNLVFVTVSTGIGGGVIADGRLLHGHRGLAAEIGHMTIDLAAPQSLFGGAPGAFEALASGTALGRAARAAAEGAGGAGMRALAGAEEISAVHVVAAARAGDALAGRLLAEEARLLGIGFVNLLHLYAPERIIVGGGLGTALDLLHPGIVATIAERALPPYRATPVVAAECGAEAGLIGAASLVL